MINRSVYSIGDMFGQIGGMDSIMMSILSFLVGIFSNKVYTASLLSKFYHVNSKPKTRRVVVTKKQEELKVIPLEAYKKTKIDESEINFTCNDISIKFLIF